jgi:hypothetical protein
LGKFKKSIPYCGVSFSTILKNWLGYILGDFFTNSSGRPAYVDHTNHDRMRPFFWLIHQRAPDHNHWLDPGFKSPEEKYHVRSRVTRRVLWKYRMQKWSTTRFFHNWYKTFTVVQSSPKFGQPTSVIFTTTAPK